MTRLLLLALAVAGCASAPRTSTLPAAPAAPQGAETAAPLDDDVAALVIRMYADDYAVRASAARALGAMGARAAPALPELVTCAATAPREAGDAPGELGDREPVDDRARAIAAIGAEEPDALIAALAIPLPDKQRALAALAGVGASAVPAAAAVYLDACRRAAAASEPDVRRHLEATTDAALAVLAREPSLAAGALGSGDACRDEAAERLSALAMKR